MKFLDTFLVRTAAISALVCGAFVSPVTAAEPANQETKREFKVSRVSLVDLVGRVTVKTHKGNTTVVKFTGPGKAMQFVSFDVRDGELTVRGKSTNAGTVVTSTTGKGSGGTVIIGNSSTIAIGPNTSTTVIIGDKVTKTTSMKVRWSLSVTVPSGQPLKLSGYIGDAAIGDIRAPLNVDVQGASDLKVGSISSGRIRLSGAGTAEIARVDGDLDIDVLGAGDVTVQDGQIGALAVKVKGAGDVKIGGKAQRARLSVVGSGDIEVNAVAEKPKISIVGSGDVSVGS